MEINSAIFLPPRLLQGKMKRQSTIKQYLILTQTFQKNDNAITRQKANTINNI